MAVPVLDLVVTLCERFQFPSLTGNSFLSSLSVRQSTHFDCVRFDQTEFLQLTYERGRPAGEITLPDTGSLPVVIQTSVSSGIAGRSLARCLKSKFSFYFGLCFLSSSLKVSR